MTEQVSLRFPTISALWAFRLEINAQVFEMNLQLLSITCECSKEHIELALTKYKAAVVNSKKENA